MRIRFQMLSIIFLVTLMLVACSGGGSTSNVPSSITVPPTSQPTTHPQLVVDVYEPNSLLVTPPIQLHGGLGTSYLLTFIVHATDYSAGILSISEQTSASLSKRYLSNGTCLGKLGSPVFASPTLYSNASAVPGGTALTDVLTKYNFDLAANAVGWDVLDATIAITVLNGHNQSATFTSSIHWDKPAPC